MQINVVDKKLDEIHGDLYILPVAEGEERKGAVRALSPALRAAIEARIDRTKFKAEAGKTLVVQADHCDIVLCGTGKERTSEALRVATAKGLSVATPIHAKHIVVGAGNATESDVAPILEGILLGSYRFDRYKAPKKDEAYKGPTRLTIAGAKLPTGAAIAKHVERIRAVCDAVTYTRDLINEMSTVKTPSFLAREARKLAQGKTIRCEVWQGEKLKKERMNGILAVSAGSKEPGAFIRLTYRPRGKARAKVAMVGKGITFDSGGLSLKPAKSMEWMKQDMAGAAAVLGVMKCLAQCVPTSRCAVTSRRPRTCPAEARRSPATSSGTATAPRPKSSTPMPRDVSCSPTRCASRRRTSPTASSISATLTGACMVALGTRIAGIMGNRPEADRHADRAGQGDRRRAVAAAAGRAALHGRHPFVERGHQERRLRLCGNHHRGAVSQELRRQDSRGPTSTSPARRSRRRRSLYAPKGGTGFGSACCLRTSRRTERRRSRLSSSSNDS